ncbi:hypothetical protein E2320_010770 [Naja naja]|nr:hypothetical protein E2320_010770 [Naja naja]
MSGQGEKVVHKKKYVEGKRILTETQNDNLWPPCPPCAPPLPPVLPYQAQGDGGDQGQASGGARPKVKTSSGHFEEEGQEVTEGEQPVGPQTHARARAEAARAEEAKSELLAPLQVNQPIMNQQGEVEYQPLFQYVPFTTTDLLNWKQHYGPLSTKPTEMADLFQTIMQTHDPTWSDVQQLMNALLTPEEKEKWKVAVRKCVKARFPNVEDISAELAERAPERDPGWEPTREEDQTKLREYQNLVVEALRGTGKPSVNMSKPSLVTQRADESPESFLQRLIEVYELYTQVDPRLPDNVRMLNERFIAQSYEDIRKKLQRVEGALGKNTRKLLEIARKVYVNRDKVEKKEKDARMQKKTELLAVALQEGMAISPPHRGAMLGPNQGAYCKGEGHWSRECLKKVMRGRGLVRRPDV